MKMFRLTCMLMHHVNDVQLLDSCDIIRAINQKFLCGPVFMSINVFQTLRHMELCTEGESYIFDAFLWSFFVRKTWRCRYKNLFFEHFWCFYIHPSSTFYDFTSTNLKLFYLILVDINPFALTSSFFLDDS